MTTQQRQRYEAALTRCHKEVAVIDAMLAEYPPAEDVADDRAALELEDLARRLGALTACWQPLAGNEKPRRVGPGLGLN